MENIFGMKRNYYKMNDKYIIEKLFCFIKNPSEKVQLEAVKKMVLLYNLLKIQVKKYN